MEIVSSGFYYVLVSNDRNWGFLKIKLVKDYSFNGCVISIEIKINFECRLLTRYDRFFCGEDFLR